MRLFFLFCVGLMFLQSCGGKVDTKSGPDFQGYFSQEIDRFAADSTKTITKNVTLNKVTEQKTFSHPEWEKELSIFKKIAIKPVSWSVNFVVDSVVKSDDKLSAIYYRNTDPKQEIKQIIITDTMQWVGDTVHYDSISTPYQLLFIIESNNSISSNYKKLVYQPAYGYLIKGRQKIKGLNPVEYSIRAWWAIKS